MRRIRLVGIGWAAGILLGVAGCARQVGSERELLAEFPDYVVMGRFGEGEFPMTIRAVEESEGGIEFVLGSGARHAYRHPSYRAYDWALVRCADGEGRERVFVLRSRDEAH